MQTLTCISKTKLFTWIKKKKKKEKKPAIKKENDCKPEQPQRKTLQMCVNV